MHMEMFVVAERTTALHELAKALNIGTELLSRDFESSALNLVICANRIKAAGWPQYETALDNYTGWMAQYLTGDMLEEVAAIRSILDTRPVDIDLAFPEPSP
jgi:hypothetical protein